MPRTSVPILSSLRPWTADRFKAKLIPKGKCLLFTGYRNKRGYGIVDVSYDYCEKRFPILAHRLAWVLANDQEIPADKIVCHTCHNPSCCNHEHLYLGTAQTNSDDMVRAGRSCKGRAPLKGIKGTAHPRALYTQEQRDQIIAILQVDCHFGRAAKLIGCRLCSVSNRRFQHG